MGDGPDHITPTSPEDFRSWLDQHHDTAPAVWVTYYKAHTGRAHLTWSEAVDEALCYGWIDSRIDSIDEDRYEQYFTRRKQDSPWSKVNKDKIDRLELAGRIRPAGRTAIDAAKQNGAWNRLDDAEALIIPDDLADALTPSGRTHFDQLAPSRRRNILQWITLAKRPETRHRRIDATARAAADGTTPNNF